MYKTFLTQHQLNGKRQLSRRLLPLFNKTNLKAIKTKSIHNYNNQSIGTHLPINHSIDTQLSQKQNTVRTNSQYKRTKGRTKRKKGAPCINMTRYWHEFGTQCQLLASPPRLVAADSDWHYDWCQDWQVNLSCIHRGILELGIRRNWYGV